MKNTTNVTRPKPNDYSHVKSYKHKIKNQTNRSVNRRQCAIHKVDIYMQSVSQAVVNKIILDQTFKTRSSIVDEFLRIVSLWDVCDHCQ